jgi:O-antigen biosynthesis protein
MENGLISIITPVHILNYIKPLYESILEQTYHNWEWVIIPNTGVTKESFAEALGDVDSRVKIYDLDEDTDVVGALKRFACDSSKGDVMVEVDSDDILVPTTLQRIREAFDKNPKACFAYSNNVMFKDDWKPYTYNETYGWKSRNFKYKEYNLLETIAPEPYPHNIGLIWFAPDHVRAWRSKDYKAVGGHNKKMGFADDHELIIKFFLHGDFVHIDEGLYIYRIHGKNTWLQNAKTIQVEMWTNYNKNILTLMEKWCDRRNLLRIDLCGGINKFRDYISVDLINGDIIWDLNEKWPFADNSVGIVRAVDALEHMEDPIHVMNEAYRVLAHGGFFYVAVPSTDGRGAFQDPTHVSFWNEHSFWYYTKMNKQVFISNRAKCRFQVRKLATVNYYGGIPYVEAHLIAIKQEQPRFHGLLEI